MKLLKDTKVQRGATVNEWITSEHQETLEGLNDFAARQRQRIADAQARAVETSRKVRALGGKR